MRWYYNGLVTTADLNDYSELMIYERNICAFALFCQRR